MKKIYLVIAAVGIAFWADPARAQIEYPLSIEETTELALLNNFDIQLAKYDAWIAQTKKGQSESIYDTIFNAEVRYQKDKAKRTSTLSGSEVIDNDYNIGLSKKLPTGTTLSTDLTNNRNVSDSPFATSSTQHESALKVGVSQDLGKNFFGIQDRGNVKLTLMDIEQVKYTALDNIEDYLVDVQKVYWKLRYYFDLLHIEEKMLDQARMLYELHQKQVKDGLVEAPEALASEANFRERKSALLLAQNDYETQSNILRLLLSIDEEEVEIIPVSELSVNAPEELSLSDALKVAFDHRQDYKKKQSVVESRQLKLSMSKNNLWPEINLSASLERNGLGDHFKQSVTQITDEDYPNFIAGLTVNIPLENTDARAQLKEAGLQDAKALLDLKYTERIIAIEITNQLQTCKTFNEVASNAKKIAQLQSDKLAEEQKRFNFGRSDTDTVIRFQEDSLQALKAATLRKMDYQTSLIDLKKKQGALLVEYWKEEL